MAKPRYNHIIALNQEEENLLQDLLKKDYHIIDLFRMGIKATLTKEHRIKD